MSVMVILNCYQINLKKKSIIQKKSTNLDGIESDEEESENSDYEYDEDDLEELNKIFNDHKEEVLSQNKPKETKVRNSVSRVQDFSNCTLFCDNYYGTIDVVEYIKSIGLEYVGTFRPSRLGKESSQNLEKLQLNQVVQYPVFKEVKLKKTTKQVLVKDVNVLQWQCKKQKTITMIYTKSKFVKQPCQMQEFVSSRGIPREQPEIVRYYNNNYKGVDYRPTYKKYQVSRTMYSLDHKDVYLFYVSNISQWVFFDEIIASRIQRNQNNRLC
ncbi:PiggyBac_transposable element-derived protein [Hexamita inflata]|uniref:PiggyBac transposable element-derived protein n=1 Tax=Hexamita inflata TaxID=28002 RepID=A0AA86TW23_9EUKA|nr:PiggyBac transposable element-derived protein [Hexamita inflata]